MKLVVDARGNRYASGNLPKHVLRSPEEGALSPPVSTRVYIPTGQKPY